MTSHISSFLLELITATDPQKTAQAFGSAVGCLTRVILGPRPGFLPPPPSSGQLATSSRFRCAPHFVIRSRVLDLHHVTIIPDDLVRSLASLGAVEHLVISDQQAVEQSPDHILITDALLLRLTSTPDSFDSTLVPKLNYIVCTSFCNFTPEIYFDFIASRIEPGRTPFQAVLRDLGPRSFEFPPEVHQNLLDLVERRELRFHLE